MPWTTWLFLAFFVLLFAAVICSMVVEQRQKRQRREAVARFAAEHGLRYLGRSRQDGERDLLDHDFKLLDLGSIQGCVNEVSGRWDGLAVREADYWYLSGVPKHPAVGGRFSIVVADLEQGLPAVLITPPSLLSPERVVRTGWPDVDVGSAGFSTMFRTQADDPPAASELIGPDMAEWLVSTGGTFAFEVKGHHLLVWCHLLDAARMATILDAATGFAAHVPART